MAETLQELEKINKAADELDQRITSLLTKKDDLFSAGGSGLQDAFNLEDMSPGDTKLEIDSSLFSESASLFQDSIDQFSAAVKAMGEIDFDVPKSKSDDGAGGGTGGSSNLQKSSSMVSDGFLAVSGSLGTFAAAVNAPIAGLGALSGIIENFVGAVDPGAVEMFQLAIKDLSAAIGSALQPLMPALTELAGFLNEMATALSAGLMPVFGVLADMLTTVGDALTAALLPVIDSLVASWVKFLPMVEELTPILGDLASAIGEVFADLVMLFEPLRDLTPIVIEVLKFLMLQLRVLTNAIDVLLSPLQMLFGMLVDSSDTVSGFADGMRKVTEVIVTFQITMQEIIRDLITFNIDNIASGQTFDRAFRQIQQALGLNNPQQRQRGQQTQAAIEPAVKSAMDVSRDAILGALKGAQQNVPRLNLNLNRTRNSTLNTVSTTLTNIKIGVDAVKTVLEAIKSALQAGGEAASDITASGTTAGLQLVTGNTTGAVTTAWALGQRLWRSIGG